MVDFDATLGEKLFEVQVRQPLPEVPAHRQQDHLGRKRKPVNPDGIPTGGPGRGVRFIEPPSPPRCDASTQQSRRDTSLAPLEYQAADEYAQRRTSAHAADKCTELPMSGCSQAGRDRDETARLRPHRALSSGLAGLLVRSGHPRCRGCLPSRSGTDRLRRRYSGEMRPLRYSINVTLDGCCDHRAIPADDDLHRHAAEIVDQADAFSLAG